MPLTTFTFGSTSSDDLGIHIEKVMRPFIPPTRDRLLDIPTRHGQLDFGAYYTSRKIDLDCWIVESTRAELLSKGDLMAAAFNPQLGAQRLILSDQPDRYWNARYSGNIDFNVVVGYGTFKLPFLCTDPFSHPIAGAVAFSGTGVFSVSSNNTGIQPVPVQISVTNPSGIASISGIILTLGMQSLKYNGVLGPLQTLVMDTGAFTATVSGGSVVGLMSGTWFWLPVGALSISLANDQSAAVDVSGSFIPAS